MEAFQDFFKELRNRASNPLISSFVIAWLIFNWPIPIGLFFYEPADLKSDGFNSYFQMIKGYYDNCKMIVYPTLVSLFYTFAFPHITALVKLIHAGISARNESAILDASKDGKMPVMKYIALKEESKKVIDNLNSLIESESETISQNIILQSEVLALKQRESDLKHKHDSHIGYMNLLEQNTKHSINGLWKITIHYSNKPTKETFWSILDEIINDDDGTVFLIENLVIDPFSRRISLRLKEAVDRQADLYIFFMQADETYSNISSMKNHRNNATIQMQKVHSKDN
jgi:hypothetical protein